MKFVSVQPDHSYFWWQVETYVDNFVKCGVDQRDIHVVWLTTGLQSPQSSRVLTKFPQVNLHHFSDTRLDKTYIPSIKPFGMSRLLHHVPWLADETIFYHDSDIIFTRPIDMSPIEAMPGWSGSFCGSYLGAKYIKSKGIEQFRAMCATVPIDPAFVEAHDAEAIGAQYVVKGTDADFWIKVTRVSGELFRTMTRWTATYQSRGESPHPIQAWTAEMWATLWCAWSAGHSTRALPQLQFSFATDSIQKARRTPIMHNAGVVSSGAGQFFKGDWRTRDPREHTGEWLSSVDRESASFLYAEALVQSAQTFGLLNKKEGL